MIDYGFLVTYFLTVAIGVGCGWYLRDVKAKDDELRRVEIGREIANARGRHPSSRRGEW